MLLDKDKIKNAIDKDIQMIQPDKDFKFSIDGTSACKLFNTYIEINQEPGMLIFIPKKSLSEE